MTKYDEDTERFCEERSNDINEYEGIIRYETNNAILFFYEEKEYWLPKSQINYPKNYKEIMKNEKISEIIIEIPDWIALEKEMI